MATKKYLTKKEGTTMMIHEIGPEKKAFLKSQQRSKATIAGASVLSSFIGTTAFLLIVVVLLFGGPGISILQEIFSNIPVVVFLGAGAIFLIFKMT